MSKVYYLLFFHFIYQNRLLDGGYVSPRPEENRRLNNQFISPHFDANLKNLITFTLPHD
jgi:hypothetical protein